MDKGKIKELYNECGGSDGVPPVLYKFAEAIEAQVLRDFGDALMRWQAPAEKALNMVGTMQRVTSAAIAWRDKHKLKEGDMLEGADVLELAVSIMKLIGWYEAPRSDPPVALDEALNEFHEARREQFDAEGNQGLKR